MSKGRSYKGRFSPRNPSKYKGDVTNIVWRSLMELRAMQRFDEHSNVLEWSSEETVIPYVSPLDGKYHRYFVDFKVTLRNSKGETVTHLIEVKDSRQCVAPTPPKTKNRKSQNRFLTEAATYAVNQAKWEAAEKACDKMGWTFTVMTEKALRY